MNSVQPPNRPANWGMKAMMEMLSAASRELRASAALPPQAATPAFTFAVTL